MNAIGHFQGARARRRLFMWAAVVLVMARLGQAQTADGEKIPAHDTPPALRGGQAARPPDSLTAALSPNAGLPYEERSRIVNALGSSIPQERAGQIAEFIGDLGGPEGLAEQEVFALKNDAINILVRLRSYEPKLRRLLTDIYRDKRQDPVMRDYALQHLAATVFDAEGPYNWGEHWHAVASGDQALAATALLHLTIAIERGYLGEDAAKPVREASLKMARDGACPEFCRATALQVCARLGVAEAQETALALARSADAGFPLRIAAIAALGDLPLDDQTVAILQAYARGPERRLRLPARSALDRAGR